MASRLDELVVLVTGGASGIGRATTAAFTARGATVAVLDRDIAPEAALSIVADLRSNSATTAAIERVVSELGHLDVVVNNAGVGAVGDVSANDDEEWHRVFDINVVGAVRVMRTALPHLRRSPHAAVVNTSSIVAQLGVPHRALYGATKGALTSLTLAMAADHVGDHIRVNAVLPGTANTPWIDKLLSQADDPAVAAAALQARQPIGRLVTPEEVANAIVYLAGPAAGSTTGTLLTVDGGMGAVRLPQ